MPWSKELEESYRKIRAIRSYLIDCVSCGCPITQIQHDQNEGKSNYCSGKEDD